MPMKPGGANAPENYDPNTGKYIKTASENTKNITLTFADGTSREIFCESEENPLEVKPTDSLEIKFDKMVAMPLFIKNVEAWTEMYKNYGFVVEACGFGNTKVDEPLGIDFRVIMKNVKTGASFPLTIDFKFINRSLSQFNDRKFVLHLLKKNTDAQVLNTKHINDAYCFMSCDFGSINAKNIVQRLERGDNSVWNELEKIQFDFIGKRDLENSIFGLTGGRSNLKNMARSLTEQFQDGYMDGLKVLVRDENGNPIVVYKDFKDNAYAINIAKLPNDKYDTMLVLPKFTGEALFGKALHTKRLNKNEIKY